MVALCNLAAEQVRSKQGFTFKFNLFIINAVENVKEDAEFLKKVLLIE